MYTTESYTTSIAVSDYKKRYIDIPTFTEYCKACPNYDRLWSCPSYTFDVEAFWNQFQTLDLFAVKILYNDDYAEKQFSEHKIADIMRQSLRLPLFTQFIASWRHHSAIDDFGCSVADKYCCKHICLILCQLLKRHDLKKFSVSSNLSDNTADSCRRSILHDNLTSLIQIILSLFAGRIIKTDSHISTCCSCQALLDQFPMFKQITENDDRKV